MGNDARWDRVPYFERADGDGGEEARAVSSQNKWDRVPYFGREASEPSGERRRTALIPRHSGERLADERKRRGFTQAQLGEAMGVTAEHVSQIERGEVSTIETVARYVQVLGGRLDLVASFGDYTLTVATVKGA